MRIRKEVAGCLRTKVGARGLCKLRSCCSTARTNGQPAFAVMPIFHNSTFWVPVLDGQE
jgi:hypothetical protein